MGSLFLNNHSLKDFNTSPPKQYKVTPTILLWLDGESQDNPVSWTLTY